MSQSGTRALLPPGFVDLLPPDAAREATAVGQVIAAFEALGYQRVKPPLIEYEETLFQGAGAPLAPQTFRLMDPASQRMMGLRADMTTQVARIAETRLGAAARPLRLCYAGQVLRVSGGQIRSERQIGQVGAELLGAQSTAADAEIIAMAVSALEGLGVEGLSVDLALPTLVPVLIESLALEEDAAAALRRALERKDAAAVEAQAVAAPLFLGLLEAVGPVEQARGTLAALDLPEAAREQVARLDAVIDRLAEAAPGIKLTVDPVEHGGFEYQTGLSFAFFSRGARGELGRGGRYLARHGKGGEEPATGLTLYMDSILTVVPASPPAARLYLPFSTPPAKAAELRAQGWITVAGLSETEDPEAEARRLDCSHWLDGDRPAALKG